VRDDDRIRKHTGVRNIVQGVLLGHPIHTKSYTIPPLPEGPLKKGNSKMESSVQDNLTAPSPGQYTLKALLNSVLGGTVNTFFTTFFEPARIESCSVHFHWNIRLPPARPG
jgi:hypothetical protein